MIEDYQVLHEVTELMSSAVPLDQVVAQLPVLAVRLENIRIQTERNGHQDEAQRLAEILCIVQGVYGDAKSALRSVAFAQTSPQPDCLSQ